MSGQESLLLSTLGVLTVHKRNVTALVDGGSLMDGGHLADGGTLIMLEDGGHTALA